MESSLIADRRSSIADQRIVDWRLALDGSSIDDRRIGDCGYSTIDNLSTIDNPVIDIPQSTIR
jgi:hypothetical protein